MISSASKRNLFNKTRRTHKFGTKKFW